MTCSLVAVVTDAIKDGRRGGLVRERFAPRVLEADPASLLDESGSNLDPDRIWATRRAIAASSRATFRVSNRVDIFGLSSSTEKMSKNLGLINPNRDDFMV